MVKIYIQNYFMEIIFNKTNNNKQMELHQKKKELEIV